jgi:hypothetical protein
MSAPDGSAIVAPDQRFRLVYRISAGALSQGYAGAAADSLTAVWQSNAQAVVIRPASVPTMGGSNLVGRVEAFTTIDIKAAHVLPTVTWDSYLADYRNPWLGILLELDMNATLDSIELLTPAQESTSVAPGARTTATTAPAAKSQASSTSPGELIAKLGAWAQSETNRIILLAVVVLLVVVAWQYGPTLARHLRTKAA